MWVSKIELTNFKSYRHAEFCFPEPDGEQNIVLIGGINGYGKTSVLEALYLCLYGKDAIVHLARAGLKTDAARVKVVVASVMQPTVEYSRQANASL